MNNTMASTPELSHLFNQHKKGYLDEEVWTGW